MATEEVLGVDLGATLCKLALHGNVLHTEHRPSADMAGIVARIRDLRPARVVATGGGVATLRAAVGEIPVDEVSEFEAWSRGANVLATAEGLALPDRHLVVSLGTGTSILSVADGACERVGGTALGGGTVLGLGRLLLGIDDFAALAMLATHGDRAAVDLVLADVYPATAGSLAGTLTAASFAKLASTAPADVAHALMGLVGENVALMAAALAPASGASAIVYGGTTLVANPTLSAVVEQLTTILGRQPIMLARGAYCGAVGAAATPAVR